MIKTWLISIQNSKEENIVLCKKMMRNVNKIKKLQHVANASHRKETTGNKKELVYYDQEAKHS